MNTAITLLRTVTDSAQRLRGREVGFSSHPTDFYCSVADRIVIKIVEGTASGQAREATRMGGFFAVDIRGACLHRATA